MPGPLVCSAATGVVLGRVVWWGRNAWCKEPFSPLLGWGRPPVAGGWRAVGVLGLHVPGAPPWGRSFSRRCSCSLVVGGAAGGCGGWLRGVGVLVVNCIVDASIFDLCAAAGLSVWWLLFCLFL